MERINRRGRGSSGADGLSPMLAEQRRGWSLLISCARATRGLSRPSLDARSWKQVRSPLEELRKTIVEMRGLKKVLVLGEAHLGASGLGG
jgi:hypothetical protein